MKTQKQVRTFIEENYGRRAIIKVLGIRNKTEIYEGIISEIYKNLFIVDTKLGKKSFNYVDILIGNIKVKIK